MTQKLTPLAAFYLIHDSSDDAREIFGDGWADAVKHLYETAIEEILPEIPIEEHAQFTRAFFSLRCVAHREMGLDLPESS